MTVKVEVPVAVGVPVTVPFAFRVNPAGRLPEKRLQLYDGSPALAVSVAE
jgi:hypothetical protein